MRDRCTIGDSCSIRLMRDPEPLYCNNQQKHARLSTTNINARELLESGVLIIIYQRFSAISHVAIDLFDALKDARDLCYHYHHHHHCYHHHYYYS
jgi:hypothetical protein